MMINSSNSVKINITHRMILVIQLCILVLLILLGFFYERTEFQLELLVYPACIGLLFISIWSIWSWQILTKSVFDPYILFLISAIIFNGGQALLEILHLNINGILNDQFPPTTIVKTLFFVILCLASWHTGGLLVAATNTKRNIGQNPKKEFNYIQISNQTCYLIGILLLAISFLPAIIVLKDATITVLTSGYGSLYEQESTTSFGATPKILSTFLIPASLFILAGSQNNQKGQFLSGIIIVSYSLLLFFLGWRAKAAMPPIAYAWLWHRCISPLPKMVLLGGGSFMLLIVFPLVKVIRNVSGQERSSFSYLLESFLSIDNPLITIISEMGNSMITVVYTLELVPSHRSFDMGIGYLYAFLTLIPNFFGGLHPTIARGTPSNWLDWIIDPANAARNRSLGYSFIAEAYLNFGWIGAPIILAIIGYLFAKLTLWAIKSSEPAKLAMLASLTAFFLFYARSESAREIRLWVWYSVIPYLSVYLISRFRVKSLK